MMMTNEKMRANETGIIWRTKKDSGRELFTLTVMGKARSDMFLHIVGLLTWNGFDIMDAKSFRQKSNRLDVFKVRPLSNPQSADANLHTARNELRTVLSGRGNLMGKIRLRAASNRRNCRKTEKTRVVVKKNDYLGYTVVRISAMTDFPGILFMISDVLNRSGIEICSAQIRTRDGNVEDIFHIRNRDGSILDREERSAVRVALEHALR